MKQLAYKLGIGIFIVSGYATEGHSSKNKLGDWEDRLKAESSVTQAAAHDEENLQSSMDQLKKVVNQSNGNEVPNLEKIFSYCENESQKGKSEEQGLLAFLYMKGWGVEKSYENAHLWAQRAAQKEDPVALRILGTLHKKGKVVEKSISKAMEFFEQSGVRGDGPAQNKLGCIYAKQDGSEANALEWLKLAAGQDHPGGQRSLGYLYIRGKGVEQSIEKGLFWYKQAAAQGLASAQNDLGWMYSQGYGVERSPQEAINYYQQAADQNYMPAIMNLEAYQNGVGVEQSLNIAIELCERAVKKSHESAPEKLEELKKQRNAQKSIEELAKEICGRKPRKKHRNRRKNNKSSFTPAASAELLVHETSGRKEQALSDASSMPLEAETSKSHEPIQLSTKQKKLKRSKKRKPQKQEGKLIGDILLSTVGKKLEKDESRQEESSISLEMQNEKSHIPMETPLVQKQEVIPSDEFSPKKPLELHSREKEEPQSAQDKCATSSYIHMSTPKEEENVRELQSLDNSPYVAQLMRQVGYLRQRNMGLNQRHGNLEHQYNLLYWQHMEALKEIEELRKQNTELKNKM